MHALVYPCTHTRMHAHANTRAMVEMELIAIQMTHIPEQSVPIRKRKLREVMLRKAGWWICEKRSC